jgi:hypothetical protein
VGAGIQTRFHLLDEDKVKLGIDAEGGFLYFALGLPVSVRLADRVWLYTDPSIGYRQVQAGRFPLGLTVGVTEKFWLTAEAAYGFDFLTEPVDALGTDFFTAGLAASYRF